MFLPALALPVGALPEPLAFDEVEIPTYPLTLVVTHLHVGDVGTKLQITFENAAGDPVPLGSATTREATLRRPDGTAVTRTFQITDDGGDGIGYILTQDGDFNQAGHYHIRGRAEFPTHQWTSKEGAFRVLASG